MFYLLRYSHPVFSAILVFLLTYVLMDAELRLSIIIVVVVFLSEMVRVVSRLVHQEFLGHQIEVVYVGRHHSYSNARIEIKVSPSWYTKIFAARSRVTSFIRQESDKDPWWQSEYVLHEPLPFLSKKLERIWQEEVNSKHFEHPAT